MKFLNWLYGNKNDKLKQQDSLQKDEKGKIILSNDEYFSKKIDALLKSEGEGLYALAKEGIIRTPSLSFVAYYHEEELHAFTCDNKKYIDQRYTEEMNICYDKYDSRNNGLNANTSNVTLYKGALGALYMSSTHIFLDQYLPRWHYKLNDETTEHLQQVSQACKRAAKEIYDNQL